MKVKSYYPYTITIDGEEIELKFKVLNFGEGNEFLKKWRRLQSPTANRFIMRKGGAEQETVWFADCEGCEFTETARDAGAAAVVAREHEAENEGHSASSERNEYIIPDSTIAERRAQEMSPEERDKFEAAKDVDEAFALEFIPDAFKRFITVKRGLMLESEDGGEQSVTTGEGFLEAFGARRDVWLKVLTALALKTALGDYEKKVSPSPIVSSGSSAARKKAPRGKKQATVAGPAKPGASAENEDASNRSSDLSGSTVRAAPSNPVQSVN